jgi:hypothetical protein
LTPPVPVEEGVRDEMLARAALLAAVLAVAAAPSAQAAKKSDCPTAGKTLVRKGATRVYSVDVRTGDHDETRTYGCWTRTGDRLRLDLRCDPDDGSPQGDDACRDEPQDIAINGPHLALDFYGFYNGEGGQTFSTIVRANVRRPRRDEIVQLDNDAKDFAEIAPFVDRLFVSPRGGVAYSAGNVQENFDDEISVVGKVAPPRRSGSSRHVRLDGAPDVESKSLRARGRELSWLRAGVRKTARWR